MASRDDITQAEHDAAHLDLFGRERCVGCRSMLDPGEQVRYQLVGEASETFCGECQERDDAAAAVEDAYGAGREGIPSYEHDEEDTAETSSLTDAQMLALLDETVDGLEGAAA